MTEIYIIRNKDTGKVMRAGHEAHSQYGKFWGDYEKAKRAAEHMARVKRVFKRYEIIAVTVLEAKIMDGEK